MVCFLLLTHTLTFKPTRSRGEGNNTKHCIKVETLVVIIQTYAPHTLLKRQKQFEEIVCERLCLT